MLAYLPLASLGVVVLFIALGVALPSRLTVERSIVIDEPVERIFPWAADLRLWPQWTVWNTGEDPTLRHHFPGTTTGLAGAMHWTARKLGTGSLIFSAFEPNRALRYEMRLPSHGTIVQGNIEFESAGAGATRVAWFDEIDLGRNPFKKLTGPVLRRGLGRAFERNLAGLKTAASSSRPARSGAA